MERVTPEPGFVDALCQTFRPFTDSNAGRRSQMRDESRFPLSKTRTESHDRGDVMGCFAALAISGNFRTEAGISSQRTWRTTAFPSFTIASLPRMIMSLFSGLSLGILTR